MLRHRQEILTWVFLIALACIVIYGLDMDDPWGGGQEIQRELEDGTMPTGPDRR